MQRSREAQREARRTGKLKIGKAVIAERHKKPYERGLTRLQDIGRIIRYRYGDTIPEHHEFITPSFFVAAVTVNCWYDSLDDKLHRLEDWAKQWAPWVENPRDEFAKLLAELPPDQRHLTDAYAGQLLGLTLDERDANLITTLSPCDMSKADWDALKRDRKNERSRERQAKNRQSDPDYKTREEYLSDSLSRTQPWKKEGISRRTWERRRAKKRNDASCSPPCENEMTQVGSHGFDASPSPHSTYNNTQNLNIGGIASGEQLASIVYLRAAEQLRTQSVSGRAKRKAVSRNEESSDE